jgi:hypothetical protein
MSNNYKEIGAFKLVKVRVKKAKMKAKSVILHPSPALSVRRRLMLDNRMEYFGKQDRREEERVPLVVSGAAVRADCAFARLRKRHHDSESDDDIVEFTGPG